MERFECDILAPDEATVSSEPPSELLAEAVRRFTARAGVDDYLGHEDQFTTCQTSLVEWEGGLSAIRSSLLSMAGQRANVVFLLDFHSVAGSYARHISNAAIHGGGGHAPLAIGWGRRRAGMSDEDKVEHDLRRARSLRELAEIEARRAVWSGHRQGLSQRQLGDLLGRSQPDVGRTIKKIEQDPDVIDPSPREFALRRAVGEYTDNEMMARLLTFTFTTGEVDPSPLGSGYLPGTWDEVRAMRREGLISEGEWHQLFRANFGDLGQPGLVLPESVEG